MAKVLVTLGGDVVKALDRQAGPKGRSRLVEEILRRWMADNDSTRARARAEPEDDMAAMLAEDVS